MARATKSRIPRRYLTKIEVKASPCKLFASTYKTNLVLYFSQALTNAERSNSGLTKSTPHERGSTKIRSKLSRQSRLCPGSGFTSSRLGPRRCLPHRNPSFGDLDASARFYRSLFRQEFLVRLQDCLSVDDSRRHPRCARHRTSSSQALIAQATVGGIILVAL